MTPSPAVGAPSFSRAGVFTGFIHGQALAASALGYGVAFGVLAGQTQLSTLEAALMSGVVYSGSAQLAALQAWSSAPLLAPLAVIIVMMNARYLLYGAALHPWLGSLPARQIYLSLFFLGDGNWALSMKRYAAGELDAGFVLGSGLAMYCPFVVGTIVGHVLGGAIGDPEWLALDFLFIAFSTALAVDFWKRRPLVAPALAALLTAVVCDRFAPGGWTIVAAGLAGGGVGFVADRERPA